MKKLFAATAAVLALLAAANAAQAVTDAEVLDSCKPHDWLTFAEAFEANDMAAMYEMMNDPEMNRCPEILQTVRVLACADDPLACVEPAGGPDIPPPPPGLIDFECPAWNLRCTDALPPPGAHVGTETNRNDFSDEGNGGGGAGGSAPSATAPRP